MGHPGAESEGEMHDGRGQNGGVNCNGVIRKVARHAREHKPRAQPAGRVRSHCVPRC